LPGPGANEDGDDPAGGIESSIRKELESLGNKEGKPHTFTAVRLDTPCLLFFKTQLPVDPAEFVHRICEEIVTNPGVRKTRYINRLTPMSRVGKATEKGLEEVGKEVLGKHFQLCVEESTGEQQKLGCSVSARFPLQPCHKPQSTTEQGTRPGNFETRLRRSTRAAKIATVRR
jgi:tRNA acetyltransferase TAN1